MKVKYLGNGTVGDFKKGEVLEAEYPKSTKTKRAVVIRDKSGEKYGYPAKWFEIIEEDLEGGRSER